MSKLFIGREKSFSKLMDVMMLGRSAIIVINGRRRIGKSALAAHFGSQYRFMPFSGLPPEEGVTAQDQRNTFAAQLASNLKDQTVSFLDWNDAFYYLGKHIGQEPTVVLLDEISWMGSKDPSFIPKLKAWWDLNASQYPQLILIFCGSVSTWIEENILNSTAFFGRITLHLNLTELPLPDAYGLLKAYGFQGSVYDAIKILSITGGVPWYIEQMIPQTTVDDTIKSLCFERNGLLVKEFERIFNDLFSRRGDVYRRIIQLLSEGMKDLRTLRKQLNYKSSGMLSKHMDTLMTCGFIDKYAHWSLKTQKPGRQRLYCLNDNYLRFYSKHIAPLLPSIQRGTYEDVPLSSIPGIDGIMGLQFESLIMRNRPLLLKALGIPPQDVVADGPYLQSKNLKHKGCQIDYLIQTNSNNIYVCEFKFQHHEVSYGVISSMKDKLKRFVVPKRYGICPVLVHVNGVQASVHSERYFYRIINLLDWLES